MSMVMVRRRFRPRRSILLTSFPLEDETAVSKRQLACTAPLTPLHCRIFFDQILDHLMEHEHTHNHKMHGTAPHSGTPPAGHHAHQTDHDRHAGHSVAMFREKFWLSLIL